MLVVLNVVLVAAAAVQMGMVTRRACGARQSSELGLIDASAVDTSPTAATAAVIENDSDTVMHSAVTHDAQLTEALELRF
jgi:hypothetical protein